MTISSPSPKLPNPPLKTLPITPLPPLLHKGSLNETKDLVVDGVPFGYYAVLLGIRASLENLVDLFLNFGNAKAFDIDPFAVKDASIIA